MKKRKLNNILQWVLVIFIIIVVNFISEKFFTRIDLTEENRFSVSDVSVDLFREIREKAFITVYFAGEMPTRYKKMQSDLETYLKELSIQSRGKLDYEFVDPSPKPELYNKFGKAGFPYFPVTERLSPTEKKDYKLLPYAELNLGTYNGIINLIKGCVYVTQQRTYEIDVQKATQNFEYNIITKIWSYTRERSKVVGLLKGHGEYTRANAPDLFEELERYYTILDVDVSQGEAISPSVDVLLVMQPNEPFREREKYEIDQYMMRGGKVLWLTDNEIINFDIGAQQSTLTALRSLNLDDLFLKYGVKINYDILQDMYCDPIEVQEENPKFPQRKTVRWVFHPSLEAFPDHPATRNLDQVSIRFGSTIDTTHIEGIRKEVVLQSSPAARTIQGTQFIDISQLVSRPIPPNLFNKGPYTLGLVLSGKFESLFARRNPPVDSLAPTPPTAAKLPVNVDLEVPKMAVISDGELATGMLVKNQNQYVPYDNKALVMNLLDYLSGDNVISQIRSKEVVLRKLDGNKVIGNQAFIQFINIVIPVVMIIAFGLIRAWLRRRKNLSFQNKSA
ncbi:MAG: Gldg family protein [Bacteroidia bacterium]|nr:Gldg family protein [Bacteroidia bacterium]